MKITRIHFGLSQRAISEKIGGSHRSWQEYESGKNVPNGKILTSIAQLGISLDWLLTGEGSMMRGSEAKSEGAIPSHLDKKLIGRLTDKIIRTYRELGMGIAWHEAAEMAVDEHNRIVTSVADPVDRMVCVGEFAAELRQRLLAKPDKTDTGKRQA
ncbi:helix-turn-helix transcriptional regulator [Thalassospira sp.]|uniref:helix-turn-helix domain-containing protein n=1 Tax=Thalassospira sp. TaxID=1912094 RepID=UPI0025FC961C|nr:helix-turn-helix transcriptional regulator [Thalassospira sp.]